MGNGKLLQVLTLLLCLSFGYFTFKNYDDVKELRNENAFLRDTIGSLLCQPGTASIKEDIDKPEKKSAAAQPDEKPAPTGVVSFINELVGDAQEEYRAAKKANENAPKKAVTPRLKVKSSYRMEDRYSYGVDDPQELGNAEGIVKLDITIDKYGDVKSAKLNSASTITDEEVIEACKKAALKTRFNYNYDAPASAGNHHLHILPVIHQTIRLTRTSRPSLIQGASQAEFLREGIFRCRAGVGGQGKLCGDGKPAGPDVPP